MYAASFILCLVTLIYYKITLKNKKSLENKDSVVVMYFLKWSFFIPFLNTIFLLLLIFSYIVWRFDNYKDNKSKD